MANVPFFSELSDPRARNFSHRLGDLVRLMVAASLCGQTTATDMALFAELRRPLLNRIVAYDRAPGHDTVSRLLRLMDPVAVAAAFARFAAAIGAALAEARERAPVALDGKALRRTCEAAARAASPMTVSLFDGLSRLCLAARPCGGEGAEGEAEAALAAIDLIDLAGRCVTADALHCHHRMTAALTAAGADYVLALKRNRPGWHTAAKAAFAAADPPAAVSEDRAHSRDERREAAVLPCATAVTAGDAAWGRVCRSRDRKAAAPQYYLLSQPLAPERLLALARGHWAIETGLHWILDVWARGGAGQ